MGGQSGCLEWKGGANRGNLCGESHANFRMPLSKIRLLSAVSLTTDPMLPADISDLDALLQRYERPLIRYALSIVGDVDSARDIVQETFIRYVREERPELHESARRLESWLFTVCRNCALDHYRKYSRIIAMPLEDDQRVADDLSPDVSLEQSDTAALLHHLVGELTTNQQEVIRLKFQNDLSYKEIAEITHLTVTNVGFLLHTALKKLRALMEEHPEGEWAAFVPPDRRQAAEL